MKSSASHAPELPSQYAQNWPAPTLGSELSVFGKPPSSERLKAARPRLYLRCTICCCRRRTRNGGRGRNTEHTAVGHPDRERAQATIDSGDERNPRVSGRWSISVIRAAWPRARLSASRKALAALWSARRSGPPGLEGDLPRAETQALEEHAAKAAALRAERAQKAAATRARNKAAEQDEPRTYQVAASAPARVRSTWLAVKAAAHLCALAQSASSQPRNTGTSLAAVTR